MGRLWSKMLKYSQLDFYNADNDLLIKLALLVITALVARHWCSDFYKNLTVAVNGDGVPIKNSTLDLVYTFLRGCSLKLIQAESAMVHEFQILPLRNLLLHSH